MEKLSGKTALVTGSTDGVGRLVARKLGQAGARVLVHGRDAERGARATGFARLIRPRLSSGPTIGGWPNDGPDKIVITGGYR